VGVTNSKENEVRAQSTQVAVRDTFVLYFSLAWGILDQVECGDRGSAPTTLLIQIPIGVVLKAWRSAGRRMACTK